MTNKDIINIVLNVTEMKYDIVFSKLRITEVVKARQFIHYFAYWNVKQTIWDIAHITGHTHATILYSLKTIKNLEFNKSQPYFGMKKEIEHKIKVLKNSSLSTSYIHCKYSTQFYIT